MGIASILSWHTTWRWLDDSLLCTLSFLHTRLLYHIFNIWLILKKLLSWTMNKIISLIVSLFLLGALSLNVGWIYILDFYTVNTQLLVIYCWRNHINTNILSYIQSVGLPTPTVLLLLSYLWWYLIIFLFLMCFSFLRLFLCDVSWRHFINSFLSDLICCAQIYQKDHSISQLSHAYLASSFVLLYFSFYLNWK